ncbi:xylogen-like protein 11 isoform X2 [Vitis riparia]|uniref:xylogen-like protein 11 isoform X2 n=1 Tax=Vitis riparia TaxID=96939 RepID=UPI00155A94D5|nr:xylogen-like protein 11 isoform X2 [Vitis riparia]
MATTSSFIVAVAVITMCAGAMAQAPEPSLYTGMAPGPSSYAGIAPVPYMGMPPEPMGPAPAADNCLSYVLNMSDCLSYVQEGSNVTVPDKPCCPELAGLLDSHPLCLCTLIGSASTYGINVTKALTLPGVCGVPTPPLSLCSGSPIGSPAGSPAGLSEGSPTGSIAESPKSLGTSTIVESSSLAFLLVLAISFLTALF